MRTEFSNAAAPKMSVNRRTGSLARKVRCANNRWYPSVILKPVAVNNTASTAKWNQSTPKYHRYSGTVVSVRTNVPIKNELVVQLMRSVGMRKITWEILCRAAINSQPTTINLKYGS